MRAIHTVAKRAWSVQY